jgi:hypothetical protein
MLIMKGVAARDRCVKTKVDSTTTSFYVFVVTSTQSSAYQLPLKEIASDEHYPGYFPLPVVYF